jgi:hypothetical protein
MTNLITVDPFLVFFGSFYLVIGLSVFFAADAWKDFLKIFAENDAVSLILGVIILPISLFIVVFYNNWGAAGSKLLMVLGILGLIKALALLLKPSLLQGIVKKKIIKPMICGLVTIAVGIALLVL